jgi:protein-disulfide isomerase
MGRPKQNLPRTLREPRRTRARTRHTHAKRWLLSTWSTATAALAAAAVVAAIALLAHTNSQAAAESRIDHEVSALLAGIPQRASTLGNPNAPVNLQVFLDLKDPDSRSWFLKDLPAIISDEVRTGALKLEYHAYKTNTRSPQEFVKDQTAALAAGAQDKLWNYIYTFYHEQGSEFAPYATETYLDNLAHQSPGLNVAQWHTDRHTERREEQTTQEDQTARTLNLHVTPSFRIGRTGGPLHNYAGHSILKYGEQHPIALPEASDIATTIKGLDPTSPTTR